MDLERMYNKRKADMRGLAQQVAVVALQVAADIQIRSFLVDTDLEDATAPVLSMLTCVAYNVPTQTLYYTHPTGGIMADANKLIRLMGTVLNGGDSPKKSPKRPSPPAPKNDESSEGSSSDENDEEIDGSVRSPVIPTFVNWKDVVLGSFQGSGRIRRSIVTPKTVVGHLGRCVINGDDRLEIPATLVDIIKAFENLYKKRLEDTQADATFVSCLDNNMAITDTTDLGAVRDRVRVVMRLVGSEVDTSAQEARAVIQWTLRD